MMTISNFWIFILSDIDQGIHKHALQKKYEFSGFLKKKLSEKKKANIIVYRTTLCTPKFKFCMRNFFFSENVCLCTKFDLRLKKSKSFGANFQNYLETFLCRIWKFMLSIFFKKKLDSVFLSPVCSNVLEKPQKWFIFFLSFFENVWKLYDKRFLHTRDVWNCMIMIFVVWNCMISIFGVWRSTRDPCLFACRSENKWESR